MSLFFIFYFYFFNSFFGFSIILGREWEIQCLENNWDINLQYTVFEDYNTVYMCVCQFYKILCLFFMFYFFRLYCFNTLLTNTHRKHDILLHISYANWSLCFIKFTIKIQLTLILPHNQGMVIYGTKPIKCFNYNMGENKQNKIAFVIAKYIYISTSTSTTPIKCSPTLWCCSYQSIYL